MRPINLLPPEAAERSQRVRKRASWILLGIGYLVLLVLIALWWQTKARSADEELADQQAVNADLERRIVQLSEARELRNRFEEGVDRIEAVLENDVAWGRLLTDLGRVIPDRTWLGTFTGASNLDEQNPALFGSMQVTGTAFDYPDVASWVRTLNSDRWPAIGGGWIDGSSRNELFEGVPVVEFSSSARLTREALSDRAITRVPEVPE
jgi:Tfp pilus assembly protein PilN